MGYLFKILIIVIFVGSGVYGLQILKTENNISSTIPISSNNSNKQSSSVWMSWEDNPHPINHNTQHQKTAKNLYKNEYGYYEALEKKPETEHYTTKENNN